jgi:hypothetical protein
MSKRDDMQRLADLALELQRSDGEQQTVEAAVARAVTLLPAAEAASVTTRSLRRRSGYATWAATDEWAAVADGLQYDLGEGPCIETAAGHDWYRSGDVALDSRWPSWGPRAAKELGVASLFSVRLNIDESRPFGALNVYARTAGLFADHEDIDILLVYSTHVAIALENLREISGLRTSLQTRHTIGLAQGILMQQYGIEADRAFELIARYSSHMNVRLALIAAEIVATRKLPDDAR